LQSDHVGTIVRSGMAAFVLVHGAWHGGWCWEKLVPLLEANDHTVDPLDLPGHGDDTTPISGMTLESYAQRVAQHVEATSEPAVLVGHSMGGMVITQAAELVPDRVAKLVYVAAFLPGDGQSLVALASNDPDELVQQNLIVDEAEGSCTVNPTALREAFYAECSEADAASAVSRLKKEAVAALVTPVSITDGRAGRIPRIYVECLRDKAIKITTQRLMHAARPCERIVSIEADHSPFYSRTEELAEHLLALA